MKIETTMLACGQLPLNKVQRVKGARGMLLTGFKHVFVHLAHNFFFKLDRGLMEVSYMLVGSISLGIISAHNPGIRPLAEPSGDGALDGAHCRARAHKCMIYVLEALSRARAS